MDDEILCYTLCALTNYFNYLLCSRKIPLLKNEKEEEEKHRKITMLSFFSRKFVHPKCANEERES